MTKCNAVIKSYVIVLKIFILFWHLSKFLQHVLQTFASEEMQMLAKLFETNKNRTSNIVNIICYVQYIFYSIFSYTRIEKKYKSKIIIFLIVTFSPLYFYIFHQFVNTITYLYSPSFYYHRSFITTTKNKTKTERITTTLLLQLRRNFYFIGTDHVYL